MERCRRRFCLGNSLWVLEALLQLLMRPVRLLPADINDVCVWKNSGLIMVGCDASRIQVGLLFSYSFFSFSFISR
jgi:hypothetical protein